MVQARSVNPGAMASRCCWERGGSRTSCCSKLRALVALDPTRQSPALLEEGQAILAIDGLQPDVGHKVLWVIGECLTGQILLATPVPSPWERRLLQTRRDTPEGCVSQGAVASASEVKGTTRERGRWPLADRAVA
jgi:hypothetical protein